VTPKSQQDRVLLGFVSGADIAHPVVAGVREDSPAARAMVRPGDVIEAVNGRPVHSWIDIFRQVQAGQGHAAKLTIQRGDLTVEADLGEVTPRLFDPSDYHFQAIGDTVAFEPLLVMVRKTNPLAGVSWGLNQTWEFVLTSYATLRQLVTGRVSGKEAAGPVGVGQMAVLAARKDVIHLVYLMAVISASVAVVNFLPFPVLDGGHAAMLILEKIRGRPLPVKVMWAMQVFGLVCIAVLFLLLTWNDLLRIIRSL
jgi:regulator of sigma E protease